MGGGSFPCSLLRTLLVHVFSAPVNACFVKPTFVLPLISSLPFYSRICIHLQPQHGHGSPMADQEQVRRGVERPKRDHREGLPRHRWQRCQHHLLRRRPSPWGVLARPIGVGEAGRSEIQGHVLSSESQHERACVTSANSSELACRAKAQQGALLLL